jgi:CRP-like cAMP-binding protein
MRRKDTWRHGGGDLSAVPVFAGIPGRTARRLSGLGTHMHVRAGQRLTTVGDRGAEVIVVLSGTASCVVGDTEEARFGPGDFFGEVATLDGGPRTATVVAMTEMDVVVFNGFEFETVVKS